MLEKHDIRIIIEARENQNMLGIAEHLNLNIKKILMSLSFFKVSFLSLLFQLGLKLHFVFLVYPLVFCPYSIMPSLSYIFELYMHLFHSQHMVFFTHCDARKYKGYYDLL